MRTFLALSVALASPPVASGCQPLKDIDKQCFSLARDDLRVLLQAGCALVQAVQPCASEIKAAISGPPGSRCDLISKIPDDLTADMILNKIFSFCAVPQTTSNHILMSNHSEFVTTVSHVTALRALLLSCDEEGAALIQCIQAHNDMSTLMMTAKKAHDALCSMDNTVLPCMNNVDSNDVCEQDAFTITTSVLSKLQKDCKKNPFPGDATSTKPLLPTSSGGGMLSVLMFLAILGFVAYLRVPRKEEEVQEWSYGTV